MTGFGCWFLRLSEFVKQTHRTASITELLRNAQDTVLWGAHPASHGRQLAAKGHNYLFEAVTGFSPTLRLNPNIEFMRLKRSVRQALLPGLDAQSASNTEMYRTMTVFKRHAQA